jgi:E3 ubiquitin-protein ligase BRE1
MLQFRAALQECERAFDKKKADLRRMEEGFLRSKKDVERQASKLKVVTTGTGLQEEAELQGLLVRFFKCS